MTIREATVTSKGQITIPVELRTMLGLKEGDKLEFFSDADGRVWLRRRDRSPTAFIDDFARLRGDARIEDDELIAAAILEKDNSSKSERKRR